MCMLNDILNKGNISQEKFDETGLDWDELLEIKKDYEQYSKTLEAPAKYFAEVLHNIAEVHSVKYRIKDPEHLIIKIIRRKIEFPTREYTLENYKTKIHDLIGLRALYLFKYNWSVIHDKIKENLTVHGKPKVYHRKGDPDQEIKNYRDKGCTCEPHHFGYRSVHYTLKHKSGNSNFIAELQVRTIFEEGWSEIDHAIRYPYYTENQVVNSFLNLFNKFAGSADEMGTYVKILHSSIVASNKEALEKEEQLKEKIAQLELEKDERREDIYKDIEILTGSSISSPYLGDSIPNFASRYDASPLFAGIGDFRNQITDDQILSLVNSVKLNEAYVADRAKTFANITKAFDAINKASVAFNALEKVKDKEKK